jgi:hypothetical protein
VPLEVNAYNDFFLTLGSFSERVDMQQLLATLLPRSILLMLIIIKEPWHYFVCTWMRASHRRPNEYQLIGKKLCYWKEITVIIAMVRKQHFHQPEHTRFNHNLIVRQFTAFFKCFLDSILFYMGWMLQLDMQSASH